MKPILLLLCCMCCITAVSYAQAYKKPAPEQEQLNIKGGANAPARISPRVAPAAPPAGLASDAPVTKTPAVKTPAVTGPSPLITSQGAPQEKTLNVTELLRKPAEILKASKQQ